IIPQNDPSSKLGIVIPIIFLQLEKVKSHCRLRLCNRGMPFVLNIRLNAETGALEKCFFYTKKDVLQYTGKYAEHVELIDHSGVPLILDKDIYHSYSRNAMKNKGLKPTEENIVKELFTVSEIRFLPGDLLVIPSDGVMETVNEKGEEYGVVKFIDDLLDWVTDPKRYHRPLNDFKEDYYYSTLRKFTVWNENYPLTGHGIEDDMTVLFIRQKTDSPK
ncbi:MAG: SpoIIE family protein phosphatase, partial [Spirochaetia bacterium]|nr:SpoIIE family protein phosphatase [Spirochaetia bacterium]